MIPRWAQSGRARALWPLLWGLPLLAGAAGRITHPKTPLGVDWASVVCGAERRLAHAPLYSADAKCPDVAMSTYVYPPWVAQALAPAQAVLKPTGVFAVYAVLFAAALALLLWAAFLMRQPWAGRAERAPFLALIGWNPLVVGNIAVVQQAAVIGAALWLGADSLIFVGVVALAALVKPTALAFLALTAFAPAGRRRRVMLVALGALPVLALYASNLDGVAEWRRFVFGVAIDPNPGGGVLRWLGDLGVGGPPRSALALAYMGAIAFAGLVMAERGGLDPRARLFLGVTAAILLTPRLEAYDLLPLGPGWLAAAAALDGRAPAAARRLRGWGLGCCALYGLASLFGGALKPGHDLAMAGLALGFIAAGALAAGSGARETAPGVTSDEAPAPRS